MNRRDSRALLIGGLIVAGGWLGIRAIPSAWTAMREAESAFEQRAELLARSRAQLDEVQALEQTVAEYEAISATIHRRVLAGWDPGSAQFDLARRVRVLLGGGQVTEQTVTPESDSASVEGLQRVAVSAAVEASMAQLVAVLGAIEEDPTLGLQRVAVTAPQPEEAAAGAPLNAHLVVIAWFIPDSTRVSLEAEVGG